MGYSSCHGSATGRFEMRTIGAFLAVAEFESEVIEALDLVEGIRNRAEIAGATFAAEIETAYQALSRARYEVDEWKESADVPTGHAITYDRPASGHRAVCACGWRGERRGINGGRLIAENDASRHLREAAANAEP
jgi:hypothetical protein